MSVFSARVALSNPPFSTFCEFKADEPPRRGQLAALCSGGHGSAPGDGPFQLPPVEPYGRSAAGVVVEPSNLRTPTALEKSMHFLVQHYLREPHSPAAFIAPFEVWRYLWDRMRQVRTNWVPQLPPVGAELRGEEDEEQVEKDVGKETLPKGAPRQNLEAEKMKQMVRKESRRRLRWLEFTVVALAVGGANLCRSVEGCRLFVQEKQNFFESIAQCFSDLVVSYRAEQRLRNSEMFSAVILFYGLSQLTKIENRAGFLRVAQVTVSSPSGDVATAAPTSVFEPPSSSVDFGSVYRELSYIPCMARSRHVRIALKIIHCWCQREWFRFFYLCRKARLTVLQRALLSHSFSYARFRAVVDLVTANVVVYGKGRVRGSMAISELADLLLFTPKHCEDLLLAMGLSSQMNEDHTLLRLAQQDASPYITQEQIYRHLEDTGGKPNLCLPTIPSFMGFTVWHEAFKLFPNAFYGGSPVATQGEQTPFITDLENMRCPVNLMQLLEPYCPPYNEDVAALELLDAGSGWFAGIQGARKRMLEWNVRNGLHNVVRWRKAGVEGAKVTQCSGGEGTNGEDDGDGRNAESDQLSEELQEKVAAMDRESVSTSSSIFDDDEYTELTHHSTDTDHETERVETGAGACGEGEGEDDDDGCGGDSDILREANLLINSLQNSSLYKLESSKTQKEVSEGLPGTVTDSDSVKTVVELPPSSGETSAKKSEDGELQRPSVDVGGLSLVLHKVAAETDVAVIPLPNDHPGVMSPTLKVTVETPESVNGESFRDSHVEVGSIVVDENSKQVEQLQCGQKECGEAGSQDPNEKDISVGSWNALAGFGVASKNPSTSFGYFHREFPSYATEKEADAGKHLEDGETSRLKRVRSEVTSGITFPDSSLNRQRSDVVLDTTTSSIDDRVMLLPSEAEEEKEKRMLEAEEQRTEEAPRQRRRVERKEASGGASSRGVSPAFSNTVSPGIDSATKAREAENRSSLSYKDIVRAYVEEKKTTGQQLALTQKEDGYLLSRSFSPYVPCVHNVQTFSPTTLRFSAEAEHLAAVLLLQESPQWVELFTDYLINFFSSSYTDATACRCLADTVCLSSRAHELMGWLCRGFTPSLVPFSEVDAEPPVHGREKCPYKGVTYASKEEMPILRLTSRMVVFGSELREFYSCYDDLGVVNDSALPPAGFVEGSVRGAASNRFTTGRHLTLGHWIAALMLPPGDRERVLREGVIHFAHAAQSTDAGGRLDGKSYTGPEVQVCKNGDHVGLWEQTHVLQATNTTTTPAAWGFFSRAGATWRRPPPERSNKLLLQTQVALHAVDFRDIPRLQWAQDPEVPPEVACNGARAYSQRTHLTAIIALDATNDKEYNSGMEALRLLILDSAERRAMLLSGVIVVLYTKSTQEDEERKSHVEKLFWSTWKQGSRAAGQGESQSLATAMARPAGETSPWRAMYQNTIRRAVVKSQTQACGSTSPGGSFCSDVSLPTTIGSNDSVDTNMKRRVLNGTEKFIKLWRDAPPEPTLVVVSVQSLMCQDTGAARRQHHGDTFTALNAIALRDMLNSAVHSLLKDYESKWWDFLRKNKFEVQ